MGRRSQLFWRLYASMLFRRAGLICFGLIPLWLFAGSMVSPSSGKTNGVKPQSPQKSPVALTPANSLLMLARCLPDMVDENAPQLMRSRYLQEQHFHRDPETNKYGVQPEDGFYFQADAPEPDARQKFRETERFADWLKVRGKQAGDTYRWRFTAKFSQFDRTEDGYPLREINGSAGVYVIPTLQGTRNLEKDIQALRKRLPAADVNRSHTGFSGGGFGGGGFGRYAQLSGQIQTAEHTLQLLRTSPPVINLGEVDPRYRVIALAEMRNRTGAGKVEAPSSEANVVDAVRDEKFSETIYPLLFCSSQIYLPESLGIDPEQTELQVELELQVNQAELHDAPLLEYFRVVRLYVSDNANDHGRYVYFHAKITDAIVSQSHTKKRWHKLGLREL